MILGFWIFDWKGGDWVLDNWVLNQAVSEREEEYVTKACMERQRLMSGGKCQRH